jgi:hypothetical protein
MSKEAMSLALEALRKSMQGNLVFDEAMETFKALEEALAKQEQGEPDDLMIAYMSGLHDGKKLAKSRSDVKQSTECMGEPVAYIRDVIEGLYENGDPISVEAAELIDKLYTTPQQEPFTRQILDEWTKEYKKETDYWKAKHDLLIESLKKNRVEPVAFITPLMESQMFDDWCPYKGNPDPRVVWAAAIEAVNGLLLEATPQQRTWVGLDPEEIRKTNHHMVDGAYHYSFKQGAEWAEAQLKEKNNA